MADTTATQTSTRSASTEAAAKPAGLETSRGITTVADMVVQKIAGLATREIPGVYALGGGTARAFSAIRERIPGATASAGQGVSVEVGEKQVAVDLQIVVEYGAAIADMARLIRRNVISSVERMTGLEVVEVNISVSDLRLAEESDGDDADSTRVQ